MTTGVKTVLDIQGMHPELKILGTSAATFFLLDLKARTSAPFLTSMNGVTVTPAANGDRAWVFLGGSRQLATIDLVNLHPQPMRIDRDISAVFEIKAVDGDPPVDARSLVVWHQIGNMGATVYNASATAGATGTGTSGDAGGAIDDRRVYDGILTEDLHEQLP